MFNVGCFAGFKALSIASDLVRADPNHVVLVVDAECLAGVGHATPDPSLATDKIDRVSMVQAALFPDGASAAIVGSI